MNSPPQKKAPLCDKRRVNVQLTTESITTGGGGHKRPSLSRRPSRLATARYIKQTLSLVDEFEHDGHELRRAGNRQLKCLCPFHNERSPSCSISPEKGLFHCFGCGAHGSVIDYHALKRGRSVKDAIRELCQRVEGIEPPASRDLVQVRRNQRVEQLTSLALDYLERGTRDDLCRLACLRSVSIDGLTQAQNDGVLRFANLRRHRAWIITDAARVVAQARRLDGGRWKHLDGTPKAWTLRGSRASWPVNTLKIPDCPKVALMEGGADLLSAYHLLWCEDQYDITPVAMLGASNLLHRVALPLFVGRRVRIYPHADPEGVRAAQRWHEQLIGVGAVSTAMISQDYTAEMGNPSRI